MKTLTKVLFIFLFFLIFCCSDVLIHYSYADIPKTLNFQAKLTDKDGVPLSGSYQIKLALYDSQTTGTKLWEETQTAAATEGVANLILGSVTALNLSFDKPYYLISELRNSYDNGVYLVDSLVEEFLQVLDEKNLSQKTIIIITADHGEELYEHQNFGHNVFYDTVVHVPLIIIHPGVHEQIRINSLAESVDIMPTILSFLQIPSPASLQGKDLTAIYKGEIPKHSYVKGYALGNSYIRSPEWKYIKRRDGQEELPSAYPFTYECLGISP